jgi:hypothetical protein
MSVLSEYTREFRFALNFWDNSKTQEIATDVLKSLSIASSNLDITSGISKTSGFLSGFWE